VVESVIFDELTRGRTSAQSREELTRISRDLVRRGVEGIVLACTELDLLITTDVVEGTPVYDSTALHVERAVRLSLGPTRLPEAD
jgi:aspartate racemase